MVWTFTLPFWSLKYKPHLQCRCSLTALANSTEPPNDIKQALHISSHPLAPCQPPFCVRACAATDGAHNGLLPAGTQRTRLCFSRGRGQLLPCSSEPHLCWARYVPQVPGAVGWDGVVNLQPEWAWFYPGPLDGLILQCCLSPAHWPRYFFTCYTFYGFNEWNGE